MATHEEDYILRVQAPGFTSETQRAADALKGVGAAATAAGQEVAAGLGQAGSAASRLDTQLKELQRAAAASFVAPPRPDPRGYNLQAPAPQPYYDPRTQRFMDPIKRTIMSGTAAQAAMSADTQFALPPYAQASLPGGLPSRTVAPAWTQGSPPLPAWVNPGGGRPGGSLQPNAAVGQQYAFSTAGGAGGGASGGGPPPPVTPGVGGGGAFNSWGAYQAAQNGPGGYPDSGRSPKITNAAQASFIDDVAQQMHRVDVAMAPLDARMQALRDALSQAAPSTLTDSLTERVKTAQRAMETVASRADIGGRSLTERPPTDESGLKTAQRRLDTQANAADTGLTRIDTQITALKTKIDGLMTQSGSVTFANELSAGFTRVHDTLDYLLTSVRTLRSTLDQLPPGAQFDAMNRQVTALETSISKLDVAAGKTAAALQIPPSTVAEANKLAAAMQGLEDKTHVAAGAASVKIDQLGVKLGEMVSPAGRAEAALAKVDSELKKKPEDAEKAESAFGKFWARAGSVATGFIITDVLNKITTALSGVGSALVNSPAQFQTYTASLTQIMGSADKAKTELAAVSKEAVFAPQTIDQVVTMDEKLQALIGTTDGIHTAFGATMSDIRTAILDTSATFPALDPNVLAKDFKIMQERPAIALRSLETMGVVTRDQLKEQGVQFDASNKSILSNYTVNANALLAVLKQNYGGMASVQAGTFSGMLSNIGDFWTRASAILGKDLFAVVNQRLHDLLVLVQTPEFQANLEIWGVRLGKLANAAMITFDQIVAGIKTVLAWLRPVTDALGLFVDSLPSPQKAIDYAAAQEAALARITKAQNDSNQSQQTTAKTQKDAEDGIKNMERANEDLRYSYGNQIQALRDLGTQMDRTFDTGKADRSQDALRKKIAQDTALAKDVFSSEGRAAAERLPQEQLQLTDAIAEQNHQNDKARNADAIEGKQKELDTKTHANDMTKRGYQDTLDAIKAEQAATDQVTDSTGRAADKVDDLGKRGQTAGKSLADAFRDALNPLKDLSGWLDTIHGTVKLIAAQIAEHVTPNWNAWNDSLKGSYDPLQAIKTSLDDVATALGGTGKVVEFFAGIWGRAMDSVMILLETVAKLGQLMLGGLADKVYEVGIGIQQTKDLFTGVNPFTDPAVLKMQGDKAANLAGSAQILQTIGDLWDKYEKRMNDNGNVLGDRPEQGYPGSLENPAGVKNAPPPSTSRSNQQFLNSGGTGGAGGTTPPQYYNQHYAPTAPGGKAPSGAGESGPATVNLNITVKDVANNVLFQQALKVNSRTVQEIVASGFQGGR